MAPVIIGAALDRSENYTSILWSGLILSLAGAFIVFIESQLDRREKLVGEKEGSV